MFYSYDLLNPRDGALSLIWQLGNLEDASKWRDVAKKSDVWNAKILDYCNEIAKRLPIQNPSRLAGPGDGGEVFRDHFSLRLTSILFSGLVQCHCLRMELILKEVRAFQLRHIRRPRLVPAIDLPKGKKGSKEAEITELNLKDDASYFGQLDQMEQGPDEIDEQVLIPRFKAQEEAITLREFEIPRMQLNEDDDNNFGMGTGADFEMENNPFLEEDLMVFRPPRKSTLVSPSLFLGGDDLIINERDEMDVPTLQLSPQPLPAPKSPSLDANIVEAATENELMPAEGLEPPVEKEPKASSSLSPLGDVAQVQKEPPKKKRRRKLAIDEKTTFDKETLTDNIKSFDQLQFSGNRFQLPCPKENLFEIMGRPMIQPHWTEKFLLCARAPYVDVEENHSMSEDEDIESIQSMENRRTRTFRDKKQGQELVQNSPKPRSELGVSEGNFEISIERDGTRNASSLIEQSRLSELKNSNLMHSLANDQPEPAIGENLPEDDFAFPSPHNLNTIVERTESLVADTSEANFHQLPPLPEPMSPQLSIGSSKTTLTPLELPSENEFLEKIDELQERGKFVTFDTLVENLRSKRAVAKCFSLILVLSSKRLLVARQTQSFGFLQVRRA